jgi:hypothetical protein
MKARKWILATFVLAMGLTTGAFAETQHWNRGRDNDDHVYAQTYEYRHDSTWNNGYRDRDYRNRDDRDRHMRARDDRDHDRRDRDDRGWDRD